MNGKKSNGIAVPITYMVTYTCPECGETIISTVGRGNPHPQNEINLIDVFEKHYKTKLDHVIEEKELEIEELEEKHRHWKIQSKGRQFGKWSEMAAPLHAKFPRNLNDIIMVNPLCPIDVITLDGLAEARNKNSPYYIKGISFIEIKTGSSMKSKRELRIQELVEKANSDIFSYVEFRPDK